jgi:2-polyprenyl-3-methyl-5-hydroxy-6-metoxy-1,4-benzoquinol methylase
LSSPVFSVRSPELEVMDNLNCSGEVVNQTLLELDTINKFLGGNHVTTEGIKILLQGGIPAKAISVADIGCGSGDILNQVRKWGVKNNVSFELYGIDANPNIIDFATSRSTGSDIHFYTMDIFSEEFTKKTYDIILATLFTHHFTDLQLVTLLRSLKNQVRVGIVINDIHRHWLAFYSIRLLTRLFSKSSMVKFDAPLSVLRAFKRSELQDILKTAGIESYTLKWKWAFRWQLIIPSN